MAESWSFSQQGALAGGGELSPGSNSTGFSSNFFTVANSSGQLISSTHVQVSGTTVIVATSTAASLRFFGGAGSTQPPAYTTAAITTNRAFVSTASVSTFTGVSGAGASFTSRADFEAFVQIVAQMYEDLKGMGILR